MGRRFDFPDCLMSGLAVFSSKYGALLELDKDSRGEELIRADFNNTVRNQEGSGGFRAAKAS